jgi:PAS domain S-box-containing protein
MNPVDDLQPRGSVTGRWKVIKRMTDIEKAANRLESIIDNSFDGIFITDGNANTILVNKSYELISGLKKQDVQNKNMRDLVEKGVISQSGSLIVLETGKSITLLQAFQNGKKALITSSPVFNEFDQIEMVVTNVRDLTEIYNIKAELKQSNEKRILLKQEIAHMQREYLTPDIVAEDSKTLATIELANRVKDLDATVMLMGETGVGKEVFAQYIHRRSKRSENAFIKVNCGAIPENLLESELFGYEKGAFTGANRNGKPGMFEVADKGTLFLDEIGELTLPMQVKLLRVLQDQEIYRVGGVKPVHVDVRIVAATNRNLEEMVRRRTFREDLYYRLMVFPIHIPPLRERVEDILPLAEMYISRLNKKYGTLKGFSDVSRQLLTEYSWPGNIRELRNVVERAYIISQEEEIQSQNLAIFGDESGNQVDPERSGAVVNDLSAYLKSIERKFIDEAYEKYGNMRDAAKSLGMSPATFMRKKNGSKEL